MSNRRGHDVRGLSIDIVNIILGGGGSGTGSPLSADSRYPVLLQEEGIIEPEDEAQDPAEVIWPIENPVEIPSPEDLWEDDDEPVVEYQMFLALLRH